MLAEHRLQFCSGAGEAGRDGSRHRLDCLRGVARSLGQDPDAVQLGIGRVFRQLPHRRAETAPRTACKLRQHVLRRLVRVRHRHGSQRRSNETLDEVHVAGGVEIDDELVAQLLDLLVHDRQQRRRGTLVAMRQ